MAVKKNELESQRDEYYVCMEKAKAAESTGMYRTALQMAISACEYLVGMLQYERRYEKKSVTKIAAIDLILLYAPLLLDSKCLERLDGILSTLRRIKVDNFESLQVGLSKARERVWDNNRLWTHLEANPETRQNELRNFLGGEQDSWRSVVEAWEKMGLIYRNSEGNSYRLSFATRMGQVGPAKCPKCGLVTEAPKAMFLAENACPKCRRIVMFVFLSK